MSASEHPPDTSDHSALAALLAIRETFVTHRTGRKEIDTLLEKTIALSLALVTGGEQKHAEQAARPVQPPASASPDLESRLRVVDERLADDPADAGPWFDRACVLAEQGQVGETRNALLEVLVRDPDHEAALNALGLMLQEQGYGSAARLAFERAVALHPDHPVGHINLARVLREQNHLAAARDHLELAIRLDAESALAHQGLAQVLMELGDAEGAAGHQRKSFDGQPIFALPYRGTLPPVTVIVLQSVAGGNVRTEFLFDSRVFRVFMVVAELYDPACPLPPHDLVFNAIGDAERSPAGLAAAESLLALAIGPVVNAPAAVLATERVANARRLAKLPGIAVPKAATFSRERLLASDAGAVLEGGGFAFPLLLRAPGFHTGLNFLYVAKADALSAALAELSGTDLTVSQFVDTRGADGHFRKYRVMMIGGQLYPLHVAISTDWKVHYFSAQMAEHPEHRIEEAAFLGDMAGVLGPRAMEGLAHVQATLDLDYAGIDFGLTSAGEILVFEANATMVVPPPKAGRRWAYRRGPTERIFAAVRSMLLERARATGRA